MAETKHEFIDDNPYITYTGKPETAYDGEGGGGGGGGYELPIASADTLGGIKVGDGLEIAESGVLSVSNIFFDIVDNEGTLDKTWNEINDAICNKKITRIVTFVEYISGMNYVTGATYDEEETEFQIFCAGVNGFYLTSSRNGYPTYFD